MTPWRLSPPARTDLDEIWSYVAEDGGIEAADRLLDTLYSSVFMLAGMPGSGRARLEIAPGTRSFPVGSYLIYYRTGVRGVLISRVLHAKRDQRAAFELI